MVDVVEVGTTIKNFCTRFYQETGVELLTESMVSERDKETRKDNNVFQLALNDGLSGLNGNSYNGIVCFKTWKELTPDQRIALIRIAKELYEKDTGEGSFNIAGDETFAVDLVLQILGAPTFNCNDSNNISTVNENYTFLNLETYAYLDMRTKPNYLTITGEKENGRNNWTPQQAFYDLEEAVLPNENGWTALMGVLETGGSLDNIRRLIDHGADINAVTSQPYIWKKGQNGQYVCDAAGNTASPLLIAADLGRADAVKHLILHGAKIDITDNRGNHIFLRALMHNHMDIVRLLLTDEDLRKHYKENKFNIYALAVKGSFVQRMRENNQNEITDESGKVIETILTLAIKGECTANDIDGLTSSKIIDVPDGKGKTPIVLAIERAKRTGKKEDWKIVTCLLNKRQIDLNQKIGNETLLSFLIKEGRSDILDIILTYDFTFKSDSSQKSQLSSVSIDSTILNQKIAGTDEPFISTLIRHKKWDLFRKEDGTFDRELLAGVDLNATDKAGKTPLVCALEQGAPVDFIRLLMTDENIEKQSQNNNPLFVLAMQQAENWRRTGYVNTCSTEYCKKLEKQIKTKFNDDNIFRIGGCTTLADIIQKGSFSDILTLLPIIGEYDNECEDDNYTAMKAVSSGISYWLLRGDLKRLESFMKELLGDDCFKGVDNFTSLSDLVKNGKPEDIQKLLKMATEADQQLFDNVKFFNGDNVFGQGIISEAIIRLVEQNKRWDLVKEIASRSDLTTTLELAIKRAYKSDKKEAWDIVGHILNQEGVDLNQKLDGVPMISALLKKGQYDLVRQMLETGKIDLDATCDKFGNTPLIIAVWKNDVPSDIFEKLITPESVDKPTKKGTTPLALAITRAYKSDKKEDWDIVRHMLNQEGVDLNQKLDGVPMISALLKKGQYDLVRQMLETGKIDLDATCDKFGNTPLIIAVWKNDVPSDIFEKLITPESVDKPTRKGTTPLALAIKRACKSNKKEDWNTVGYILDQEGVDLNQTINGKPLIFVLIEQGHLLLVKKMIEKGVDLTVKDEKGRTPLDCLLDEQNWKTYDGEKACCMIIQTMIEYDKIPFDIVENVYGRLLELGADDILLGLVASQEYEDWKNHNKDTECAKTNLSAVLSSHQESIYTEEFATPELQPVSCANEKN